MPQNLLRFPIKNLCYIRRLYPTSLFQISNFILYTVNVMSLFMPACCIYDSFFNISNKSACITKTKYVICCIMLQLNYESLLSIFSLSSELHILERVKFSGFLTIHSNSLPNQFPSFSSFFLTFYFLISSCFPAFPPAFFHSPASQNENLVSMTCYYQGIFLF